MNENLAQEVFPSKFLLEHHKDGKRPFRAIEDCGYVFCAYSLDTPLSECPYGHRSEIQMISVLIDGKVRQLMKCCDVRLQDLPGSDYIVVSKPR